jgi:chromosome segregation ATPase
VTDDRTLAFLRELERADEEAAATLAELDELAAGVERIRTRTLELETFRTRLPAEREVAGAAVEAGEDEANERRAALEGLEGVEGPTAASARVRAQDALRNAERRLEAARAQVERLEAEAEAADREAGELVARARELAGLLRARPGLAAGAGNEPEGELEDLQRWATDARAALFVARGNLAKQREALIRQANELGALVLGEPLGAQSPAAVARRVEATETGY